MLLCFRAKVYSSSPSKSERCFSTDLLLMFFRCVVFWRWINLLCGVGLDLVWFWFVGLVWVWFVFGFGVGLVWFGLWRGFGFGLVLLRGLGLVRVWFWR